MHDQGRDLDQDLSDVDVSTNHSLVDHVGLDRLNSLLELGERLLHALVTEMVRLVVAKPVLARDVTRTVTK